MKINKKVLYSSLAAAGLVTLAVGIPLSAYGIQQAVLKNKGETPKPGDGTSTTPTTPPSGETPSTPGAGTGTGSETPSTPGSSAGTGTSSTINETEVAKQKKIDTVLGIEKEITNLNTELSTKRKELEELNKDATNNAEKIATLKSEITIKENELNEKVAKQNESLDPLLEQPVTFDNVKTYAGNRLAQLGNEIPDFSDLFPSKEEMEQRLAKVADIKAKVEKINVENLNVTGAAYKASLIYYADLVKSNYVNGGEYTLTYNPWGPNESYIINPRLNQIRSIPVDKYPRMLEIIKEAKDKNLIPSKVFVKLNVASFIRNAAIVDSENRRQWAFKDAFTKFIGNRDKTEITITDFVNSSETAPQPMKDFIIYYATEFYNAATQGLGENIATLKLTKANTDNLEKENTLMWGSTPLYGLGLTDKDLEANNIGVGAYVGDKTKTEVNGETIYNALAHMATTTNLSVKDIYEKGYQLSKNNSANFVAVASLIADLIAGKGKAWTTTIKYDADGPGRQDPTDVELNIRPEGGQIDIVAFRKWLNSEDFFFGREDSSYYTEEIMNQLDEDESLDDARRELTVKGYSNLQNSDSKYKSITNKQFYYGALEAFKGYNQFREATYDYGEKFFKTWIPKYGIKIPPFARRKDDGVGYYNGGERSFTFNADPYYGLPKWSLTSFANHESMMGHHNQIIIAKYYKKQAGTEALNVDFDNPAYAEGWALFTEWFAIESGWYGTPNYTSESLDSLPTSFKLAKGITSFITTDKPEEVTDDMVQKMKTLHTGVYWNKVAQINNYEGKDKEHALAAAELANMLQYIGALNEAQLRNMRWALDTAFHGSGFEGNTDLPKGASIKQVREFMKANSALGLGDIESESKRYAFWASQALSYNAGKETLISLYDKVRKNLGLSREEFVKQMSEEMVQYVNDQDQIESKNANIHSKIAKLFDVFLTNGSIPMVGVEAATNQLYNLKD